MQLEQILLFKNRREKYKFLLPSNKKAKIKLIRRAISYGAAITRRGFCQILSNFINELL
jgi:hypothetical protein